MGGVTGWLAVGTVIQKSLYRMSFYLFLTYAIYYVFKENQNTPRPSEHPPVMGEKMSKRLGGIKGCK